MKPVLHNLHTHTFRCKHATGDVDDYCRAALDAGLECIGISDHTPLPDDRWLSVRMPYVELPDYMDAISEAQSDHPNLRILRSAECEYDECYESYYREEMLGEYACDYLIGAVHFFPHQGEWLTPFSDFTNPSCYGSFTDYFIETMESGLFSFIAHPDNFGASIPMMNAETEACTHAMCQAAVDLGGIWEVNGYGYRKTLDSSFSSRRNPYPIEEFWDIVSDYPIKVIANSDAHRPQDIASNIDDALDLINRKGLELASLDEVLARSPNAPKHLEREH
jgi:histidinol-phosphatase (PHP family)